MVAQGDTRNTTESLGNSSLLKRLNLPNLCPRGREAHCLYHPDKQTNPPSGAEEDTSSVFQAVYCINILEKKYSLEQKLSVPLLRRHEETHKTYKQLSSNKILLFTFPQSAMLAVEFLISLRRKLTMYFSPLRNITGTGT